jgi:hypothetical protein
VGGNVTHMEFRNACRIFGLKTLREEATWENIKMEFGGKQSVE